MNIENIITAKNASAILNAIILDVNNIKIDTIKYAFEESKKYLKDKKLFNIIYNFYNQTSNKEIKNYFKDEANILFDTYLAKPSNNIQNLIIDCYNNKKTLELISASSLDDSIKTQYYQSVINNSFAYNITEELSKLYPKYDFHIIEKNYTNWHFKSGTFKNLIKAKQFSEDIKKLNSNTQLHLISQLTHSTISEKEFEKLIPYFNKLFKNSLYDLNPSRLGLNNKTLLFYEKNNLKLKDMLSHMRLEDIVNQFSKKEHELLIKKLIQENTHSHLLNETHFNKEITLETLSNISHNWLNLKELIEFKNQQVSTNENFLNLTKKMLTKFKNKTLHERLSEATISIEKDVFEEKLSSEPSVVVKKLKI